MRERSEIPAGANRAFLRNDRTDAPVEHFTKQLDHLATDATQTEGQDVRAQHHHRAHLRLGQRISNSAGVTADEVQLKLAQFAMRNPDIGEFAESGGDSIHRGIAHDDLFDQFARRENTRTRERRNVNGFPSESDRRELKKGNLLAVQLHSDTLVRIVEPLKRLNRRKKKARPEYDLASWASPPKSNCCLPDLFSGFPHRWSHNLLVLRTSPESQASNQNSHDHDRFQKFQSI